MKLKNIITYTSVWVISLSAIVWLQGVFAEELIENFNLWESLNFVVETNTPTQETIQNNSSTDFNIREKFYDLSIQKKSLSCESSATSDILETLLSSKITEDDVINLLPKDSTFNSLPRWQDWKRIWWNPNVSFVWNIDNASQNDYTWYGVYEQPIAYVYNQYGFETEILNIKNHDQVLTPEYHLSYILKKLEKWNMVQLWGDWCTDPNYEDWILENMNSVDKNNLWDFVSAKNTCEYIWDNRTLKWHYYDESWELVQHTALSWEHAFILLGWKWDISNPSHIRVWDTDTGYHMYETVEWMRKWEAMDYRSIVITK